MGFSLRALCNDDVEFSFQVFSSTRAEEMAIVPWDEAQKRSFLEMQFNAQRQWYLDQFPEAEYHIILRDGISAGRLIVHRNADRVLLVDVALLPEHRNHGIGTQVIEDLKKEAQQSGKPLWLDVENFSPAFRLYQRLGFKKIDEAGFYWRLEWVSEN